MDMRLPLKWSGIMSYLAARVNRQRVTEYVYDLIWLGVKANHDRFDVPMPSMILHPEKKDTRTAEDIKSDLIKKLEGRA